MAEYKSRSKIKKFLKGLLIVIVALVVLVVVGARLYFRLPVSDYYKASEKAFTIPGLSQNMIPQGLDYVDGRDVYLVGGYQKDGTPSRVYKVNSRTGKTEGYVILGDGLGNGLSPHAGGLAVHDEYLFVAGDEDSSIYIYNLEDVLSAGNGETVRMINKFRTKYPGGEVNVACLTFTEDHLIVAEFYRVPNYVTDKSHWITTPAGDENHAFAVAFPLGDSDTSVCGVERTPTEIYSLPGLVQGIAVHDGKIWVSQSYGTAKSTICCYDVSDSESVGFVGFVHSGVAEPDILFPVYALDSSTLVASFDAPPMAEEIIFKDDKLLIMCESASAKYIFGNFTGGRSCYATDVDKLI
ncbi:MAG: hypothetical protein IKF09_01920 [Clostridiales bacterium]|nr:hypothetical protein [Clostridiales bacterium]